MADDWHCVAADNAAGTAVKPGAVVDVVNKDLHTHVARKPADFPMPTFSIEDHAVKAEAIRAMGPGPCWPNHGLSPVPHHAPARRPRAAASRKHRIPPRSAPFVACHDHAARKPLIRSEIVADARLTGPAFRSWQGSQVTKTLPPLFLQAISWAVSPDSPGIAQSDVESTGIRGQPERACRTGSFQISCVFRPGAS